MNMDAPHSVVDEFIAERRGAIPHDVVAAMLDGATPALAWREFRGLSQQTAAERMDITLSAYAQMESSRELQKSAREHLAEALQISPDQLDF